MTDLNVYSKEQIDSKLTDFIKCVRIKIIGTGEAGQPPTHYINANAVDRIDITDYIVNNTPAGYKPLGQGIMFCTSIGSDNVIPDYFYYYNSKYWVAIRNFGTAVTLNNMWIEVLYVRE